MLRPMLAGLQGTPVFCLHQMCVQSTYTIINLQFQ